MSQTINPLSSTSPVSSTKKNLAPGNDPMLAHAKVWQHIGGMDQGDVASKTAELSYSLPIIGALAGDPKTTRKDVIKAAAAAAGAGKIEPSKAVGIISNMPDDPDKLQSWLKGIYATNLSALVHLKAAAMPQQAPQAAPGAPAPQAPQPQVPPQ